MKRKIFIQILLIGVMLLNMCTVVFAHPPITINFNGEEMEFDSEPIILNSRTLVPVRFITERLGANVGWDNDTKTVTITYDGKVIKLQIDNDIVDINGEKIKIDTVPVIRKKRTLVPIRFISENFGADVLWNGDTYTVDINRAIVDIYCSSEEVKVGESVEVIFDLKEAYDIYGYQIDGTFNNEIAEIESIITTDYIDGMTFRKQYSNEEGNFSVIKTKLGKVEGNSGKGELVRIKFKVKKAGSLDLKFNNQGIKLVSSNSKYTAVKVVKNEIIIE